MQVAYIKKMEIIDSPRKIRRKERLIALLAMHGGATQVAIESGTPKSHISAMIKGSRGIGDKLAAKLEALYGKEPGWFDLPPSTTSNRLKIQVEDEIIVNQFDTGGAMGHGVLLRDQPGIIKQMVFNREWLGKNLKHYSNESNLCLVTGFGDSMRGMYNSGDPLIVDKGVTSVEFDGVYFFRVGDEGFIKRLQRVPGEGLIAISENKAYRDWTISEKMDFEVFGRVLRAWHSEDY